MPTVSCLPGFDGDLELGADAVIGGDQDRVDEAGRLEVEQAAEAADLAVGARPAGRAHQRLDLLDHGIAGVDVDAGLGIGEPVLPVALSSRPWLLVRPRLSSAALCMNGRCGKPGTDCRRRVDVDEIRGQTSPTAGMLRKASACPSSEQDADPEKQPI